MFPLEAVDGSVARLMFPGSSVRAPVIVSPDLRTKPGEPVTLPHETLATFASVTAPSAIPGFGYAPLRLPPAAPEGGRDAGAPESFTYEMPLATLASVTAAVASWPVPTAPADSCAAPTAPAAIWLDPTTPAPIPGFGYVPERLPPAPP